MIECSAQKLCKRGHWFHLTCINMSEEDVPEEEDWWCSKDCEWASLFCSCKRNQKTGKMINCSGTDCPGCGWYHLKCVGLRRVPR